MSAAGDGVTRRQRQVLQLIADGHCPKQVAHTLALQRTTVDHHLCRARQQLKASSTGAAVATLMRRKVIR